uniref:Fuz_longin_2 domain-containing protein n=1 Tax=Panagrellus redivivus TaxID=6233 RepID=A0A7E4VPU7_PANRE
MPGMLCFDKVSKLHHCNDDIYLQYFCSTVIELKRSEDAASVSATLKGYSEAKVTSETYRAPKDVIPNHISKTEKQVFNVLILAVSQGALIALYENIKLIYKSQTHYHASGYVVTFDSCSIRFITEIVYQIPEAQKALTAIVKKYFAIHDFIVLTEGKEGTYNLMDVLNTTVPTRARKQNIHFFNVLAFRPNEASNEPPNKVIDIFKIFDYASWKTLRQQADSDNYDKHVLSMEAGIHQFTETIKTARPVTFDDMQMVAYLKRLSAELRTHELTPSIQRLWATIDAHMVDSDARNYMMDARPLNNDELQAQADYWRIRNMEIANLLYKISVFARIGNNLESSSNTNDGAGNTICGNNVTTTKPTSYDLPLRVFHPDVTRLTVLIIGRSKANNAIIIDSIVRNRESEASPITNTENEWIVNYDEYEIKYVNILLNNAPIDWSIYPVIHGFIFVIENKVPHFSFIVEKNLRNLLGMIPRSSAKNCCIVNCFVATSLFSIADASEQLSKFVATFCENHQLTTDVIKHLCVDKSNNTSSAIDTSIEEFVLRNAESPVTMNALKVADCLRELAELLDQKSVESNIERLMASITDRTMSDAALYFREHSTMALPLTNDEWKIAIEWDIDEDLLEVLREINDCFKLDEATGLGKVKSTSMFAMKTGTSSTLPQRSKVAYTKASSVPPVAPTETVKTTQYNVVLLGSSVPNKEMLLNTINCVQQHENCNAAANNADVIKFRDSDDYLIDYGTHSIRYINKDELNIEQSDFHGLMIVIENGTLELSTKANNQIRNVFGRLPRRAMKNCCIVNTFTPSETFALNDAEQQMREFTTKFCEQHALTESPSFICVDTVTTQAVLDHNVTDNANLCQKTSNCKMAWPTRCVSSAFDVGCHSRKRI